MAMHVEGGWGELNTRGFVVVRNFLSQESLSMVLKPYLGKIKGERFEFHPARLLGPEGVAAVTYLEGRVRELFPEIEAGSGLHLTTFDPFSTFFPNNYDGVEKRSPPAGWHSDPPPYHLFQDMSQYLNCWIPLIKPKADTSGLTLLPMDALRQADPAIYEAIHRHGGAAFASRKLLPGAPGYWHSHRNYEREVLVIDRDGELDYITPKIDVDTISVTPDILPGDVIFARGDVMHRAQDQLTNRVAISVRSVNGDMKVHKEFLRRLPEFWRKGLANPEHHFGAALLAAFSFHGRETLTVQEVLDYLTAVFRRSPAEVAVAEATKGELLSILGLTEYGVIV